eukprot:TRINITY_DN4620_c0_g1_i9.p1 TRINITY_DN4620_c0_g1~~TRINITY_DN4620_c0_g1_i9.p1  ORF type:complete len:600 (+),score=109.36 TRINITY_DN4620_c0_g1_i9:101-1900(+)
MAHEITYPSCRRDESIVDDYHGVKVTDPYRWLEDPDSEETKQFVTAQNVLTQSVLSTCETRQKLKERMTELYNYPRFGCPYRQGDNVFYHHNSGLQAQSVLYIQPSLDGPSHVLLDPNQLSSDGTVTLSGSDVAEDGQLLAYALSSGGSEWKTVHVLRATWPASSLEPSAGPPTSASATHPPSEPQPAGGVLIEHLDDELMWVKHSSCSWTRDNQGFFYNRHPEPPRGEDGDVGTETDKSVDQKVFYHRLGSTQAEDVLCWQDQRHPTWAAGAQVTEDGQYVVLSIYEGSVRRNQVFFCHLQGSLGLDCVLAAHREEEAGLPWVKLVDTFEAEYSLVANEGPIFWFQTNLDAPRNKVVRVNVNAPVGSWEDVIPESADVLEWVMCINEDCLVACYMHHVKSRLQICSLASGELLHTLPLAIGAVSSGWGRKMDADFFFSLTNFLSPANTYRCHLARDGGSPRVEVFRKTIVPGIDTSLYESQQVFVSSKDGTQVPMFVLSKKGIPLDGSHPALLYGYGGFSISLKPSFSVNYLLLMHHLGCVVAVANLRGGNEYGHEWRNAGSLDKKQNVFDDFQVSTDAHGGEEAGAARENKKGSGFG